MRSRREMLVTSASAGAAFLLRRTTAFGQQGSSQTPVNFQVPAGACDCHVHIFGDVKRFPFFAGRTYTPPAASISDLRARHQLLHMERVVIIQPSVYGTDNACTLDALQQLGPRARAVAVVDANISDAALDSMHRQGVRGIRINLGTAGVTDPNVARQRVREAAQRLKGRPWHVQLFTQLSVVEALSDDLDASPVPLVFDHFAQAQGALGVGQPGFATLLNLVRSGKAYVKISGPYLCSRQAPDYADMQPLARALIEANPQRILWGSNWPHPNPPQTPPRTATDITPPWPIDDGRVLNQLAVWVPGADQRKAILVDNPARLYAF
jgi:predicted TIM-barrel fold metal-dependent hydrolase